MSWWQPGDLEIELYDEDGNPLPEWDYPILGFRGKLKLFFWNRCLPTWIRLRLLGSRLERWLTDV